MTKEQRSPDDMGEKRPGQGDDQHRDDDNSRREENEQVTQSMGGQTAGDQGMGGQDKNKDRQQDKSGQKGDSDKTNREQSEQGRGAE